MKKRSGVWRLTGLLLTVLLLLMALPAFADGFDHAYVGQGESGEVVDRFQTTLFELRDGGGNIDLAYCVDTENYIVDNGRYARVELEDAKYFSAEQAAKIRAVVHGSYPALTIEALRTRANLPELTVRQAVTGTQLAIWYISNGGDYPAADPAAAALKTYLLSLAPLVKAERAVGSIELVSETVLDGETCNVRFRYSTTAENADGSPVTLTHGFTKAPDTFGARVVSETSVEGGKEVLLSGVPVDADFSFFVEGVQSLPFDAYFYRPQGGRTASQSLVGAYGGNNTMYAEKAFSVEAPDAYQLAIHKYDSKTGEGIEGAVFELADNAAFTSPTVYEQTTDQDGYALFSGLKKGVWYLREKQAPAGYVPDTKTYDVEIDGEPQGIIEFKNAHCGQIKIVKLDDAGGPLAGATFSVYRGPEKNADALVAKDLLTDADGVILCGDLTPGFYYVEETAAPAGYHMSSDPGIAVEVVSHETVTITMVNPRIKRGRIGVAKEDYTSHERLLGAVVAVYSDAACTDELWRCETEADAKYTDDLMPGTYYVKELAAPEGYILNPANAVRTVELLEGGEELVVFRNRRRIDTAGNYGLLLTLGLALFGVTGLTALMIGKKRKKER